MTAAQFLQSVLDLRPQTAIFDCDGTLWANNSGEDFLDWSLARKMVPEETERWIERRMAEYRRGEVDETTSCGEMVVIYNGTSVAALERAAAQFFAEVVKPNYFEDMRALTHALRSAGCDLWAVSSTNEWVIREGVKDFGIAADHVIAVSVEIQNGCATNRLVRVPSAEGKSAGVRDFLGPHPDAVFGNSIFDREMLEMAKHSFAVNPNPDLEKIAAQRGWTIYWPEKSRALAR